jgi:DNA-binding HxlR family transcriptional regulator
VDYDLTPLGIEAAERAAPLADWIEMNMHNILESRRLRQTQHVG